MARRRGSPWTGLGAIFLKEFADHLGGARMMILEWLMLLAGVGAVYTAIQDLRQTTSQDPNVGNSLQGNGFASMLLGWGNGSNFHVDPTCSPTRSALLTCAGLAARVGNSGPTCIAALCGRAHSQPSTLP